MEANIFLFFAHCLFNLFARLPYSNQTPFPVVNSEKNFASFLHGKM